MTGVYSVLGETGTLSAGTFYAYACVFHADADDP